MKIGTKVRTLYQHSETGTVVKPRKGESTPTPEWNVVRFDLDGARGCIHNDMLTLSNAP